MDWDEERTRGRRREGYKRGQAKGEGRRARKEDKRRKEGTEKEDQSSKSKEGSHFLLKGHQGGKKGSSRRQVEGRKNARKGRNQVSHRPSNSSRSSLYYQQPLAHAPTSVHLAIAYIQLVFETVSGLYLYASHCTMAFLKACQAKTNTDYR